MPPEIITKLYAEATVENGEWVTAFHYGSHDVFWTREGGGKCASVLIKGPESMRVTSFDTLEEAAEFLFVEAARVRVL